MMEGGKAEEAINVCVKDWKMESMDEYGHFRGILTAWNPLLNLISVMRHESTLETKLKDGETWIDFTILNVCGPFYYIKAFWETFENSGAMRKPNVIMGRDLNLMLTMSEVWGEEHKTGCLELLFHYFF